MSPFELDLTDIVPQQHFLSRKKLEQLPHGFRTDDYGEIWVISYRDRWFSVDGHHRLFLLDQAGVCRVTVVNDPDDNDRYLYRTLADEALALGLTTIRGLGRRIIEDPHEYEERWIGKCQRLLREEERL